MGLKQTDFAVRVSCQPAGSAVNLRYIVWAAMATRVHRFRKGVSRRLTPNQSTSTVRKERADTVMRIHSHVGSSPNNTSEKYVGSSQPRKLEAHTHPGMKKLLEPKSKQCQHAAQQSNTYVECALKHMLH